EGAPSGGWPYGYSLSGGAPRGLFRGPFLIFGTLKRTQRDGANDAKGNDRRGNGDPSARRSGRGAHLWLSGRRGAADLRRALSAGEAETHSRPPRAGRDARRRRLRTLDWQGRRG